MFEYKGKRLHDKQWVYGSHVKYWNVFKNGYIEYIVDENDNRHIIDPKTLCVSWGWHIDGAKVWTNDKIRDCQGYVCKVKFFPNFCGFRLELINDPKVNFPIINGDKFEIIGNVWDGENVV